MAGGGATTPAGGSKGGAQRAQTTTAPVPGSATLGGRSSSWSKCPASLNSSGQAGAPVAQAGQQIYSIAN